MASQSTSKQLVNYGATVIGGVALTSATAGLTKGISAYNSATAYNDSLAATYGVGGEFVDAGAKAVDAAKTTFTDTLTSTFNNPAFLTSVGLGVAGILLGSGSKRPSLMLPNVMATAGVALSVGALLKQGRASIAAMEDARAAKNMGGAVVGGSTTPISPVNDPGLWTSQMRDREAQGNYSYPLDLTDDYYIKLSLHPYQRITTDAASTPGNPHTVIKLPLPTNLIDAIQLAYTDLSLGMFGGPILDSIAEGVNAYNTSAGSTINKMGKFARAGFDSMKNRLRDENVLYAIGRRLLTNSTLGSAVDLVAGNTPNPHMAVTFNGVNLRKHTYSWRLSPTSEEESKSIRAIVRNLQAAALPKESSKGLMLSFPDIAIVEINPMQLMTFRPCAIDNVVVNYTPNGVPAFFASKGGARAGHPVEMELSVTLREIDIHTAAMPFYAGYKEEQLNGRGER